MLVDVYYGFFKDCYFYINISNKNIMYVFLFFLFGDEIVLI